MSKSKLTDSDVLAAIGPMWTFSLVINQRLRGVSNSTIARRLREMACRGRIERSKVRDSQFGFAWRQAAGAPSHDQH